MKKIITTTLLFTTLSLIFVVPKINSDLGKIEMRWMNILFTFIGSLLVFALYYYLLEKREKGSSNNLDKQIQKFLHTQSFRVSVIVFFVALMIIPFVFGIYHTKILTLVFIYIIFSLGLNIIVGLTGMLCLGQAFFLGVGAYTYALLNTRMGVGFYSGLAAAAVFGSLAGILFAIVTIRLRGDYLAIVTLGLSEIFRITVTNMNFTGGPRGISGIAKPGILGLDLDFFARTKLLYFISLACVVVAVFFIRRLEHSRFGRSWESFREDEIASASMGVHVSFVRIEVFAINGFLGGIAGVLFAANTSFIDPTSFSILVSVTALCIVVLGGLGSISGVVLGSLVLILLPEYLRVFAQYRMLLLGAILVFMMLFRPSGLIPKSRTEFLLENKHNA